MDVIQEHASFSWRASQALNRAEVFYLRVLRAVILVVATFLLAYAGWLAVASAYKMTRSTDSVKEVPASVSPDELVNAATPSETTAQSSAAKAGADPAHVKFYSSFGDRYFGLYKASFEPYRQPQDKKLTRSEFDGAFIGTPDRLKAIEAGDIDFASDRKDLESLLAVMAAAAKKPATVERLGRYKSAKKVPVQKSVSRTRTEYVDGWDSNSTSCPDWYYSPYGCSARQAVEIPYTEKVTTMEFPKGTQSHTDIFQAFQDRFFMLLSTRRETNAENAQREREDIISGISDGRLSLWTALQIVGGFLVLMFFFLLIAIERHQRRLVLPVVPSH